MWGASSIHKTKDQRHHHHGLVAIAIDRDKGSQYALKWVVDHLVSKGENILLIHVNHKATSVPNPMGGSVSLNEVNEDVAAAYRNQLQQQNKELFLPFRCFCSRKEIHCTDVVLEDADIAKAIIEYVKNHAIENLVVGASSRNAFLRRFKAQDVPAGVSKGAPDFCTVYVIGKGKISSVRSAVRAAPTINVLNAGLPTMSKEPETPFETPFSNGQATAYWHADVNAQALAPTTPFEKTITNLQATNATPFANAAPFADQHNPHVNARMNHRAAVVHLNPHVPATVRGAADTPFATPFGDHRSMNEEMDSIKSPFSRGGRAMNKSSYGEVGPPDADISFVSSGRPSTERMFPTFLDHVDSAPRLSNGSSSDKRSFEYPSLRHDSDPSLESGRTSWSSQNMEDVEAEMKRLKLELKQTLDLYSTACKEALNANKKASELHHWKIQEERRLEEARMAEEAALQMVEREKAKCKVAVEAAEAAQRIAQLEAQKRINAEMKALKEAEEKKKALNTLAHHDVRYRKYTIEEIETATDFFSETRKIGEGGYGPVYRCYLDHTQVAIKVLRPDAAQGRSQFQQEVEVLSCIRHPNMVLLLGACPEYGCLVYEYMANGSLEDRLFRRGGSPVLPWQLRFRIAAEIGTSLLFLHQTKPEPLVHRDLKPANILLDRNFVSKISDVGLARLVPPTVADNVTQYRMTSTAGTFCYIDPEYQQTGMLGIKSDVYSLGIMLLQIITAKPPMGLTHHVDRCIEKGTLAEILDPAVPDWPIEETLAFAKLALQCAELRRKDRPDLGEVILPQLERLRAIADETMPHLNLCGSAGPSPNQSHVSMRQDVMSDPCVTGYESLKSRTNQSSVVGRRTSIV